MERWGVFSVVDHRDKIRLAIELLLYDKIAVPTPIKNSPEDWKRWEDNGWEPAKLMEIIKKPKLQPLFIEAEWDREREENWRAAFEEAKARIEGINAELWKSTNDRVAEAKRNTARLMEEEQAKAIKAAAYWETRDEIVRYLKEKVKIYHGPVAFYAAYQSVEEFEKLQPQQDAIKQGVERANFIIKHRLAVPELPPDELLDSVAALVSTGKYQERRRLFYKWQTDELRDENLEPKKLVDQLNDQVKEFNASILEHHQKCRWETVVAVAGIVGGLATIGAPVAMALLGAKAAAALSVAGGSNAIGAAILRKKKLGRAEPDAAHRICSAGAMFHSMNEETGFEFRVR